MIMNTTNPLRIIGNVTIGVALLSACLIALAQTGRFNKGDLVEYTSAFGPTLGEVITGPDPSNYYLLAIPGQEDFAIRADKLRLVQRAGTPDAAMNVGEAVSWTEANVAEKGSVVKVRGAWCQVKSASATTFGWVECKALRTAKQNAQPPSAAKPPANDNAAPADGGAATANLDGDYENADGSMKLELQGKGKCYISLGPMTGDCTYKQSGKKVVVRFEDEDMVLTANNDGSLTNAPEGGMPVRFKKRK
jgi:hypothetical protein